MRLLEIKSVNSIFDKIKKWLTKDPSICETHPDFTKPNVEEDNCPPAFKRPSKESNQVPEERREHLRNIIRNNVVESIEFMLFNNNFNFHQDENMFKLHLNMLYFDYIIDSVDSNLLIEIDEAIKEEMDEHINQKRCEQEISQCVWH